QNRKLFDVSYRLANGVRNGDAYRVPRGNAVSRDDWIQGFATQRLNGIPTPITCGQIHYTNGPDVDWLVHDCFRFRLRILFCRPTIPGPNSRTLRALQVSSGNC